MELIVTCAYCNNTFEVDTLTTPESTCPYCERGTIRAKQPKYVMTIQPHNTRTLMHLFKQDIIPTDHLKCSISLKLAYISLAVNISSYIDIQKNITYKELKYITINAWNRVIKTRHTPPSTAEIGEQLLNYLCTIHNIKDDISDTDIDTKELNRLIHNLW